MVANEGGHSTAGVLTPESLYSGEGQLVPAFHREAGPKSRRRSRKTATVPPWLRVEQVRNKRSWTGPMKDGVARWISRPAQQYRATTFRPPQQDRRRRSMRRDS